MAGVPSIMQAMLDAVAPTLQDRRDDDIGLDRRAAACPRALYGTALGAVQKAHPGVVIGSYPSFDGQRFTNQIVVRARDEAQLAAGAAAVEAMLVDLTAKRDAPAAGTTA